MVEPVVNNSLPFAAYMEQASGKYGPELISKLASDFGIEPGILLDRLVFSAAKYFEEKDLQLSAPNEKFMRDEFQEIGKSADDLHSKISSLSEPASELYWRPQRNVFGEFYLSNAEETPFGSRIVRLDNGSGSISVEILKETQILEAIEIIAKLARHAVDRLPPDQGGRPSNSALQAWIFNMLYFWEKDLKKRFTFGTHHKEGVTRAFLFCEAALQPLDEITAEALSTAMRYAIRTFRAPRRQAARLASRKNP